MVGSEACLNLKQWLKIAVVPLRTRKIHIVTFYCTNIPLGKVLMSQITIKLRFRFVKDFVYGQDISTTGINISLRISIKIQHLMTVLMEKLVFVYVYVNCRSRRKFSTLRVAASVIRENKLVIVADFGDLGEE